MLDLRYHVASLAAVFLALIIGILVGVGVSGRGFVDKSERKVLDRTISGLHADLEAERQRSTALQRQQAAALAFIKDAYPALMSDRLLARRIAVVYVGSVDNGVGDSVARALSDAGAAPVLRLRALKVPIDAKSVDATLAGRPALRRYVGDKRLSDLGKALAEELVRGGQTPLWDALSGQLAEERSGGMKRAADGVVLVRSVGPQEQETARFLRGFYAGLRSAGAPAVGVESSGADPSAINAYRKASLSSVDDVETATGRLALSLLLAGGQPGHYGLRDDADGILPVPIEPLATATVAGG